MADGTPSAGSPAPVPGTLHHVELYVSGLEHSLRFWRPFLTALGYVEYQRWDAGVSYRLGDMYIVFVQAGSDHVASGYHRQRVGLNHLAFHAASTAQVDELTAWVRAAGFVVLYADRHPHAGGPGTYALYCEDPDRIKVELVAPTTG
jgi:catechol 2,3-dioxygenase-like lactoylglutathione lyase family enzyme